MTTKPKPWHGIPPNGAACFWLIAAPQIAALVLVLVLLGRRLAD
ncbi:hypothetical protein [Ancylobacter polymorphus]|nr:hypothetical protein [Ancylobacter polymorphus]